MKKNLTYYKRKKERRKKRAEEKREKEREKQKKKHCFKLERSEKVTKAGKLITDNYLK